MDYAALKPVHEQFGTKASDQRGAQRFTLLIRAAKLITDQGEFICVIRDVSTSGVSVRLFHGLPATGELALELQSGERYSVNRVWQKDNEAGFEFTADVDVSRFISEVGEFPKRGIRLAIEFPATVHCGSERLEAFVENISQQGARLSTPGLFAIEQNLRLEAEGLRDVRAKVRWRGHGNYGVVFDDTFGLAEFARLAARLQAPSLLSD